MLRCDLGVKGCPKSVFFSPSYRRLCQAELIPLPLICFGFEIGRSFNRNWRSLGGLGIRDDSNQSSFPLPLPLPFASPFT